MGLLSEVALLQRQAAIKDAYGQVSATPVNKDPDRVACRLRPIRSETRFEGKRRTLRLGDIVEKEWVLFFPPDVGLENLDEIAGVEDPAGTLIVGRLSVQNINAVPGGDGFVHHYEVRTKEVS